MSGIYCACGKEITRGQHCAESDEDYAKRLAAQRCRAKCARLYPPSPPSRVSSLEGGGFNHQRPEMKGIAKEKPEVDERYRTWIRQRQCVIPCCPHEAQFHHQNEKGHGSKGAVCSDYRGLPLCAYHHTLGGTTLQPGSYHGMGKTTGWKFWEYYGIDVEATIHKLNAMWLEKGNKFKIKG